MNLKMKNIGIVAMASIFIVTECLTVFAPIGFAFIFGEKSLDLSEEWIILLIQACLVAFPFVTLLVFRTRDLRPWLVVAALTLAFWSLLWIDPLVREGGGANIGLGILLLFSPVVISMAAAISIAFVTDD